MEEIKGYEHADKRICKYGLQIESCRKCLFENLCELEKTRKENFTHN